MRFLIKPFERERKSRPASQRIVTSSQRWCGHMHSLHSSYVEQTAHPSMLKMTWRYRTAETKSTCYACTSSVIEEFIQKMKREECTVLQVDRSAFFQSPVSQKQTYSVGEKLDVSNLRSWWKQHWSSGLGNDWLSSFESLANLNPHKIEPLSRSTILLVHRQNEGRQCESERSNIIRKIPGLYSCCQGCLWHTLSVFLHEIMKLVSCT